VGRRFDPHFALPPALLFLAASLSDLLLILTVTNERKRSHTEILLNENKSEIKRA